MPESDLHISERLKKLLPPLTTEERKQLKENIETDGKVQDTIRYWNDGKRNVVCDGMHRWDIIRGTKIQYDTEELYFADYEEAEVWILNHQLGRRNLLRPSDIRKIRGELYNRLKRADKGHGDHTPQSDPPECQLDTPPPTAAEKVAEKAGVSESTVKRDGARVEAMEKLSKAAKVIAASATEAEVKALAKLLTEDQDQVARAVRTGQAKTVKEAMKGFKPPASENGKDVDYGKCPNCAGTRWKEDADGLACAKCHHPHGEPAGDVDDKQVKLQRSKTVKTVEALMRAFDDLQLLISKPAEHEKAISDCKRLLKVAGGWK